MIAAHHVAQGLGDAGTVHNARRQHSRVTQNTLERERHEEEEQAAQKTRIEDRLEGVGLRVFQFTGVTNGGFKAVG